MYLPFLRRIRISFSHNFLSGISYLILPIYYIILDKSVKTANLYYLFFVLYFIFFIYKIIFYKHLYHIDLNDSRLTLYCIQNLFKQKKYEIDLSEIDNLFYRPSSFLIDGYLNIKIQHKQDMIYNVSFNNKSLTHQKLEKFNLENEFNSSLNKVKSFFQNSINFSQNKNYIKSINQQKLLNFISITFSILILLTFFINIYQHQNYIFNIGFFIIFLIYFIVSIIQFSDNKLILFDVEIDNNIITLYSTKDKNIEINQIDKSSINEIKYTKSIFILGGELNIILKENEQLIYTIKLPDNNLMNKKIKMLIAEHQKSLSL